MWLPVNVKGSRKDNKQYSKCGGNTKLVYCAMCRHYYCFDYNSNNKACEPIKPKYGASDTMLNDKENKNIYQYGIIVFIWNISLRFQLMISTVNKQITHQIIQVLLTLSPQPLLVPAEKEEGSWYNV